MASGTAAAVARPVRGQVRGLACPTCPYGVTGRCAGLTESSAGAPLPEGAIGCHDARSQALYYRDLHQDSVLSCAPRSLRIPPLPAFIPVLVRVLPEAVRLPGSAVYAVGLTTVLRAVGTVRYREPAPMRRQLGLGEDGRLCLLGTATDQRLERAWVGSKENQLWKCLVDLSFEFVTTTTFSIWQGHPRFDQIFNQERNLYSYDRFATLGTPVAPFLFFPERTDLIATREWLERHPEVDLVAFLAQYYRRTEDFERLLEGMHALQDASPRPLRLLVTGCATAPKIERLFAEFSDASVASTKPVMRALKGRATTPALAHRAAPRSTPRSRLVPRNIRHFTAFCEAARRAAAGAWCSHSTPGAARRTASRPL